MGIKHTYTKKEKPVFEVIDAGFYPAQVTKFDISISNGAKTNGSDQMELMFTVYKDDSFTEKLSTVRDTIIFHKSCDWKADKFAETFGLVAKEGEAVEFDEPLCLNSRGWLKIKIEKYKNAAGEAKESNKVDDYPTNKPRIPRFHEQPDAEAASDFPDPGE